MPGEQFFGSGTIAGREQSNEDEFEELQALTRLAPYRFTGIVAVSNLEQDPLVL